MRGAATADQNAQIEFAANLIKKILLPLVIRTM